MMTHGDAHPMGPPGSVRTSSASQAWGAALARVRDDPEPIRRGRDDLLPERASAAAGRLRDVAAAGVVGREVIGTGATPSRSGQ